ncbi:MAG: PorP/SprF family type IX secretion system membrane protein, partial [Spirochaetaceae bacterium]|nr:PorP/SprF family type IX secretion system membrane protein [Spirochaetaceae bacterium]
MKKIIAVIVVVCAVLGAANAQTDPLLNHYMFNRTFINPASSGNTNDINFFFALREQWVGFEDAPSTQVFAVNGYIDPIRSGLGLAVINDHEGAVGEHRLNAKVNYAYHLFLSRKAYLSFGLSAGLLYCKTNFDNARTANPETANNLKSQSAYNPDFDFGLEFNMEKFTLGASCTHLIKSNDDVNSVETPRHFYAYGKYTFDINDKFAVVPQVTFMNNEANVENNQLEMNVTGFYMKKYWA